MDFIKRTNKNPFTNDKSLWNNALYGMPLYSDILSASITNNRFNKYSKDTNNQAEARDKYPTRQHYINATIPHTNLNENAAINAWDALWLNDNTGNAHDKKPPNYVSGDIKNPWDTGHQAHLGINIPNRTWEGYSYQYNAGDVLAGIAPHAEIVPGNINIPHDYFRENWLRAHPAYTQVGWDGQPSNWVMRQGGGGAVVARARRGSS